MIVPRLRSLALILGVLVGSTFGVTASTSLATASPTGPVTKSTTVQRTFLDAGKTTVVDRRKVTLTVDQTTSLRSLQLIHVSWTGAQPTGGTVADVNSDLAQNQEHSFALFECRGVDSSTHNLSPDSCWTQFADERFSYGYDPYPAWRSDAVATPAERTAFTNAPSAASLPLDCANILSGTANQRWVPFVGADKHSYAGGPFGCAGSPPEASPANYSSLALPSNETFGVTGLDGRGEANFDVFTGEDHASLGCSSSVPCSLVAVPIEGISCDAEGSKLPPAQRPSADDLPGAAANCESTGHFSAGQQLPVQGRGDPAVDGTLWWSPSNWSNRISVPLTFAPADNVCALNSSAAPVDVYGSELMIQASTQWAPAFCLDKNLFNLNHVQTPEPQARNLLATGNVEAAYTSDPPDTPYPNPTVNAPVAVTGFGIAYDVDGKDQRPLPKLNLDARLLAKLLSQSYPDQTFVRSSYPALGANPLNITRDPEFQALNPNASVSDLDGAATLLTVNTDSDVVQALTSYINADPEARAWLDGQPDPWGMVVNPNYKKIALPVNNWPLLDTFEPTSVYQPGKNDCLYADPVPYLPLVAAPTARLFSIGQDLQFALSQSQVTCVLPDPSGSLRGAKMVAYGRQPSGRRALFGVVSLGDAAREGLSLASLESHSNDSASTQITDGSGRTFVAPTTSSLRAAAKTLRAARSGTWPIPYSTLHSDTANGGAYPGAMVVYAAVPTRGIPAADAKNFGKLLAFAAARGQQPGTTQGDLPDGYLPMTAGNGLGGLAAYTDRAAKAVTAQRGYLPSLTKADPLPNHPAPGQPASSPASGHHATSPGGAGDQGPAPNAAAATKTTSTSAPAGPAPSSLANATPAAQTTPEYGSTLSGALLPLLLAFALVGGAAASVVRVRAHRKSRP